MVNDSTLYRRTPATVHAQVLSLCQGARALDDHAQRIKQLAGGRNSVIREAVAALVRSGVLRPMASPASDATPAIEPARIGSIGVITADRPAFVKRGLSEAIAHVAQWGRRVRFIVVHGSPELRHQILTRAAVADARASVHFANDDLLGCHERLLAIQPRRSWRPAGICRAWTSREQPFGNSESCPVSGRTSGRSVN